MFTSNIIQLYNIQFAEDDLLDIRAARLVL